MTTLRDRLTPPISALITSRFRRDLTRNVEGLRRRLSGAEPTVHYFHQVDDPYSHLSAQLLGPMMARYRIALNIHLVPAPDDAAAPERERLRSYGLRDAGRLAEVHGLSFPKDARLPGPETTLLAARRLAADLEPRAFAALAPLVGAALWSGRNLDPTDAAPVKVAELALAEGEAERRGLGHYLGGMFQFEGEWYWGVDRLNHLEQRLAGLGLDRSPAAPMLAPYKTMRLDRKAAPGTKPVIEFWFSFRSPYVSIAFPRVRILARHYGADLRLRPILPMIMRGLPVPPTKSRYIMLDTMREAERVAMPYGRMIEPVGAPTERCMAVLWRAMALGKGEAFGELALQSIFAHGRNPAEDAVLFDLGRRAGLTDDDVRAGLADDSWRAAAEENRQALFDAGLWGAPSYCVNGKPAHWGQDRLRMLEDDIP